MKDNKSNFDDENKIDNKDTSNKDNTNSADNVDSTISSEDKSKNNKTPGFISAEEVRELLFGLSKEISGGDTATDDVSSGKTATDDASATENEDVIESLPDDEDEDRPHVYSEEEIDKQYAELLGKVKPPQKRSPYLGFANRGRTEIPSFLRRHETDEKAQSQNEDADKSINDIIIDAVKDDEMANIIGKIQQHAKTLYGENYNLAQFLLAGRDIAYTPGDVIENSDKNEMRELKERILSVPSYSFGKLESAAQNIPPEVEYKLKEKFIPDMVKAKNYKAVDYIESALDTGILDMIDDYCQGEYVKANIFTAGNTAKKIRTGLSKKVYGQNHAITAFAEGYFRGRLAAERPDRTGGPRATFLFAGPPGSGKTYTAENAAKILGIPSLRLDMSVYAEEKSYIDLVGSSNRFRGGDVGLLTMFAQKNPCSIIIVDELEKAHRSTINLFLQILDSGYLIDANLEIKVDFTNTIMVFTTNSGNSLYEDDSIKNLSELTDDVILNAIASEKNEAGSPLLSAPIMSRLRKGKIVMFNAVSEMSLYKIIRDGVTKTCESFIEQGIKLSVDDKIPAAFAFANNTIDARGAAVVGEKTIMSEIYEFARLTDMSATQNNKMLAMDFKVETRSKDIKALFENSERGLLFTDMTALKKYDFTSAMIDVVSTKAAFVKYLNENSPVAIFVDYSAGCKSTDNVINFEDIDSLGKEMFEYASEKHPDIPLFTLSHGRKISEEEIFSMKVKGAIEHFVFENNADEVVIKEMIKILPMCHHIKGMLTLQAKHLSIDYETKQKVNEKTGKVTFTLYNLKLKQNVEQGDASDIMVAGSLDLLHWDDVIISDDVKDEVDYAISYLKDPSKYNSKKTGWTAAPRGILLYGAPGTGKTSLAKVIATEAGVNFINVSADEFNSKYVGEGSKKIHQIFAKARKYAPCVLFIDEIDAIGRKRSVNDSGDGKDLSLTALLTELDGFETDRSKPIFVIAATNLGGDNKDPGALDPALIRRFDRPIRIELPNADERRQFMKMLDKKIGALKLSPDFIENIVNRSVGMSFATLRLAVDTALRMAMKRDGIVNDELMDEAFEKFNHGDKKKPLEKEIENVAHHEAGHAIVANYFGLPVSYLTITSREGALGYMSFGDTEENPCRTREDYLNQIAIALAGRAAEMLKNDDSVSINSGASSDLSKATIYAEEMVMRLGMSDVVGIRVVHGNMELSEEKKLQIDNTISDILVKQLDEAKRIITAESKKHQALVKALIKKQHLTAKEIRTILEK